MDNFRTYGGVIQKRAEPHVVVVPTLMWVKALDMILDKLRVCGVDFSKVAAISGCAQVKECCKRQNAGIETSRFINYNIDSKSVFSITPMSIKVRHKMLCNITEAINFKKYLYAIFILFRVSFKNWTNYKSKWMVDYKNICCHR